MQKVAAVPDARRTVPRAPPKTPHCRHPSGYRGVSDHLFGPLALPNARPARWSLTPRMPVAAELVADQVARSVPVRIRRGNLPLSARFQRLKPTRNPREINSVHTRQTTTSPPRTLPRQHRRQLVRQRRRCRPCSRQGSRRATRAGARFVARGSPRVSPSHARTRSRADRRVTRRGAHPLACMFDVWTRQISLDDRRGGLYSLGIPAPRTR